VKRSALRLAMWYFKMVYSISLMQTRLASLHSKVALLDQSHVAAADMRLQVLCHYDITVTIYHESFEI